MASSRYEQAGVYGFQSDYCSRDYQYAVTREYNSTVHEAGYTKNSTQYTVHESGVPRTSIEARCYGLQLMERRSVCCG